MRISVKWLKEYIKFDLSPKELGERLIMTGSEVDEVIEIGEGLDNVVVGRVEEIKAHPNADKLILCSVNVGDESPIQIVCGAPNVYEGAVVAVALPGAKLPGGISIKKAKVRGVESAGMLCSMKELGIGEEHGGIMILSEQMRPGDNLVEALNLRDTILDLEITPNRPDCLSVLGIAREVSAITGNPVQFPTVILKEDQKRIEELTSVEVLDDYLAPRYAARVIKDIKVGPSPAWLQERVRVAGMRPINNIVDITNFVMMEYGQPLHAFDYNKLSENRIVVRRANEGEKILTLDGTERTLSNDMLVIADAEKPVAVGGVMGGADSEVDASTSCILLESANFYAASVRRTARKLGLRTEASARFEKGLPSELVIPAIDRAAQLIRKIAGGKVAKGIYDVWRGAESLKELEVNSNRVNKVLGTNIPKDKMMSILTRLGFEIYDQAECNQTFKVKVPYFRGDVSREADIIEEVARIYGFDKIEATLPRSEGVEVTPSMDLVLQDKVRTILIGCGLDETITYSFINPKAYDLLRLPADDHRRRFIQIGNPLTEEQSVMRTTLIPSLLEVVARNAHRGVEDCHIFEIGATYIPEELPLRELPEERRTLAITLSGHRSEESWDAGKEKVDFFELKGILEVLFEELNVNDYEIVPSKDVIFHPMRQASIIVQGKNIGFIGEMHPDILEGYGLKDRVQALEIELKPLVDFMNRHIAYKGLPRYPAVLRDIAIIADKSILSRRIQELIEKSGGSLIEKVHLFDTYSGAQIPEGKRSLAYSIIYRHKDRTLTDEEINVVHERIMSVLTEELGVEVRK